MSNLSAYFSIVGTLNGRRINIGSRNDAITIALASDLHFFEEYSLSANSNTKIFDVTENLGDFDVIAVLCDQDITIQLVTDDTGAVGEEDYTLTVKGSGTNGTYGLPFVLGSDASYANHTVDTWSGHTIDTIDRIDARTGASAAKVLCFAAT